MKKYNVGIIGSGAISGIYLKNMTERFANLEVKAISARNLSHAETKAKEFGITALMNDDMLKDESIDIVVILTPVETHYDLIKQALNAGKHVYTEKTIAATVEQAKELCALADEKELYLGSAPDTFLGTGFQTAIKALDDQLIGEVNSFSISITRDNNILTAMFLFLRTPGAGALRDYMVYYLTALVATLGPVKRVSAILKTPYKERMNNFPDTKGYGEMINTPNEAIVTAVLEMENGIIGTIHEDNESIIFDRADFAICGTKGVLLLGNPNQFGDPVYLLQPQGFTKPEPVALDPVGFYSDNSRGIGPSEMADAITNNRINRANKEMAVHVLDVIEAIEKSSEEQRFIDVNTTCQKPSLFIDNLNK